jgi:hypothetical protein
MIGSMGDQAPLPRSVRLARVSTKRSIIWTMTPRCFLEFLVAEFLTLEAALTGGTGEEGLETGGLEAEGLGTEELEVAGIEPRRTGGAIFSKLKAGMVHPLVVELKHSLNPSTIFERTACDSCRSIQLNADAIIQA